MPGTSPGSVSTVENVVCIHLVVPCWCIPKALPHIFIQRPGTLCSMACGPTVHIAYWQLPSATPIESVCPSLAEFEGLLNRFGQRVDELWLIRTRSVMPGRRRHGLFTWSVFSAARVATEPRWAGLSGPWLSMTITQKNAWHPHTFHANPL